MRDPKPDPMRELIDIMTRLSQRVAELRLVEQEVAQTVLSDIAEAAAGSIQTLTERAGMSEASVIRFAKAMGCRDVRELKFKLAQAAAVGQCFLDGSADRPPSSTDGILADISSVLEANRALVQPEAFHAATAASVTARMIAVFGMSDSSTTMVDRIRYRLVRLGRPVTTYHDPMLQRMVAAMLSPDDVVIVFSVIGHVSEVIDSVITAREYGVRIVAITAIGSLPATLADVLLPVQAMEIDFVFKPSSSRCATMMMIDLPATEVVLQQADRNKELLRHIKYVLDAHRGGGSCQPLGD